MKKQIEYLVDCSDDSEFKTPFLDLAMMHFKHKCENYRARLWKVEDGKKTIIQGFHGDVTPIRKSLLFDDC